jgi:excisionase family DNA binding protein
VVRRARLHSLPPPAFKGTRRKAKRMSPANGRNEQTGGLTPTYYTVEDAARILGVSTKWIYERTRKNAIPFRRLGKLIRFTQADLEAIAALQSPAAASL